MSRYIVFEPSGREPGIPSDRARFVRDRFARWAVLFPHFWLFRHRLWLSGALTLCLWIGFGLLAEIPGLRLAAAVLPILLGCLVALEGPSLRAWKLHRKGFQEVGIVEADDEEEAAILYYAGGEAKSVTRETFNPPVFVGRGPGAAASLLDPPRTAS